MALTGSRQVRVAFPGCGRHWCQQPRREPRAGRHGRHRAVMHWCSMRRTSRCVSCRAPGPVLVLMHKAVALEDSELVLHSATLAVPAPSVVRLTRFVKIPYRGPVPLTSRALFARDGGRCVYCGNTATSIDHVVPAQPRRQHVWANVVSACRRCNHVKADRAVSELGWRLRPPEEPGHRLADPRHRPVRSPLGALSCGLRRRGRGRRRRDRLARLCRRFATRRGASARRHRPLAVTS